MTEIWAEIANWFSNSNAFANTAGVANTVFVFILGMISTKNKAKANTVTVDVKNINDEMSTRMDANEEQTKLALEKIDALTNSIDRLTDFMYMFASNTQIGPKVKAELTKLYNVAKPVVTGEKVNIKEVVETATEIIETAKPLVKDVYEQLVDSINKG